MHRFPDIRLIGLIAIATAGIACGSAESASTPHPMGGGPDPNVLVGAGDIASCSSSGDQATANILDGVDGTVIVLGDVAYPDGSTADFADCYEPSWGRHKSRTRPAVGNHEYQTTNAAPYYAYFGAAAGDPTKGYYSFDTASWHVIVLNSNCSSIGGCGTASPQYAWLQSDLAANPVECTIAYWHHPAITIGPHSNATNMLPIWQALYDNHVDVAMSGHDHNYQRYAELNRTANGTDPGRGIRYFVVGTGGVDLTSASKTIADATPGIQVWADTPNDSDGVNGSFGVIKLTLSDGAYAFQFLPVAGQTFTDSGSGACHSAPDADSDGIGDTLDNCPAWANPTQSLPSWPVPADDADCDGSSAGREAALGTAPALQCSTDTSRHNEPTDAWPPDNDDNRLVNLSDILSFSIPFGATPSDPEWTPRLDLHVSASPLINMSDVLALSPYFALRCA